jgi:hypothetical protein
MIHFNSRVAGGQLHSRDRAVIVNFCSLFFFEELFGKIILLSQNSTRINSVARKQDLQEDKSSCK